MIAYLLNKDVGGEKILSDIQKLVSEFRKTNPDSIPILYINIKSISHDDTTLTKKLEHKIQDAKCST